MLPIKLEPVNPVTCNESVKLQTLYILHNATALLKLRSEFVRAEGPMPMTRLKAVTAVRGIGDHHLGTPKARDCTTRRATLNRISKVLAMAGALVAGPAFLLNYTAHGGSLPDVDNVDRADGAFSLMLMAGVALIVTALWLVRPSPLGRKGRYLLGLESLTVVLATMWAVAIIVDPGNLDSSNAMIVIGDACWPLHQALMLFVGIAAVRGGSWPSPERFALCGPAAGVAVLLAGAATGVDIIAATAIGAGWAIVGVAIVSVLRRETESPAIEHREFALST